jgi:predicted outer membrane protein
MRRITSRATLLRAVTLSMLLALTASAASQAHAQTLSTSAPITPLSPMEQLNQIRTNQALERDFLRSKFQADQSEIELLRMALCQSPSPDVRAFARNTIHRQLILDQMLYDAGVILHIHSSQRLPRHDRLQLDHIEQRNGAGFNAAFLLALRHAYRNDQQDYDHESGITQNPGLKLILQQGLGFYSNRLAALHTLIRVHHATRNSVHKTPPEPQNPHPSGCLVARLLPTAPRPFSLDIKA